MKRRSRGTVAAVLGTCCLAPTLSQAQDPSESAEGIGLSEVVVTATKQGQSTILTTPIAIQALGMEQLKETGSTDFNDYFRMIPGLSTWDQGPGNKRIILRGINSTGAGTVGLFLDEAVITGENSKNFGGLQPDPKLFDVERVEVLKGPQGTTFGAGAMSGVIRYITNKPNLDDFGGTLRVGVSRRDDAGNGTSLDSAVNLPVMPGRFALRVAGYYENSPGWVDDRYEKGVNSLLSRAGRIEGRLKINDRATLDLMAMTQNNDVGGNSYYNRVDFVGAPVTRENYQVWPERLPFTDHMQIYNATFVYELDSGTLTATASHSRRFTDIVIPASQVMAAALHVPQSQADTDGVRSRLDNDKWRNTDNYELRYASHFQGPIQTLVGLYHSYERRYELQLIPTINSLGYVDPSTGIISGPILLDNDILSHITETALFGEVKWAITPSLNLTLGGRAFQFDNNSHANVISAFGAPGPGFGPIVSTKERSGIGRFNLQYTFSPKSSTYLQIAQGYRPGGTNSTGAGILAHVTIPPGYNSDRLINYELGFKQTSFENRLRFTAAAFFIDWSKLQVALQTPVTPTQVTSFSYTGNAGKAHVKGLEAELEANPIRGLRLALTAGYTDAKNIEGIPKVAGAGAPIPYTPRETVSASVDYRFPVTTSVSAFVGADTAWTSSRVTAYPENTASLYARLDPYAIVNGRVGVDLPNNWTISLIGKNLLNNNTVIDVFRTNPGIVGYLGDPPRLLMLQFTSSF